MNSNGVQVDVKKCSVCEAEKPVAEFYVIKAKTNGKWPYERCDRYMARCKACVSEDGRRRNDAKDPRRVERRNDLAAGLRYCPRCSTKKSLSDFAQRRHGNACAYCRECEKAYLAQYVETRGVDGSLAHRVSRYGLSLATFKQMLDDCGFMCEACGRELDLHEKVGKSSMVHVDHDHLTGKVRGILCHYCNLALGHARDDPATLIGLLYYLEERGVTA